MSTANDWLERLYALTARLSKAGVSADLACLTLAELWGLSRFLERKASEGDHGTEP